MDLNNLEVNLDIWFWIAALFLPFVIIVAFAQVCYFVGIADIKPVLKKAVLLPVLSLTMVATTGLVGVVSWGMVYKSAQVDIAQAAVKDSVKEFYGLDLSSYQVNILIPTNFKATLSQAYGGEVPEVFSFEDLSTSWRSSSVEVATDEGVASVFLANDVDGKTYLWTINPDVKEKFEVK